MHQQIVKHDILTEFDDPGYVKGTEVNKINFSLN